MDIIMMLELAFVLAIILLAVDFVDASNAKPPRESAIERILKTIFKRKESPKEEPKKEKKRRR